MSEKSSIKESLLTACKKSGLLSPEAESCSVGTWVDCSQGTELPLPHTIVPITVQLAGNRAASTYGFWTAELKGDSIDGIAWYTLSGMACGWVREWYAVPRSTRLKARAR